MKCPYCHTVEWFMAFTAIDHIESHWCPVQNDWIFTDGVNFTDNNGVPILAQTPRD
jgi:hypothetical protein